MSSSSPAPLSGPRGACRPHTTSPRDRPVPVPSPLASRVSPSLPRWPRDGLLSLPLSPHRRNSALSDTHLQAHSGGPRDLYFFTHPERWEVWPFLPIVR